MNNNNNISIENAQIMFRNLGEKKLNLIQQERGISVFVSIRIFPKCLRKMDGMLNI